MPEICLLARIRGRVQGVSFRYYTRQKAQQLGLFGWVKNLPDGSVEANICGEPAQVRAMQTWLKHGPSHASVMHIDFTPGDASQCDNNFSIRQ